MTGGNALYGLAVQRGAQIAIDEINCSLAVSMVLRLSSISRMMKQMLRSQLTLTIP